MDPVSAIVGALCQGAISALTRGADSGLAAASAELWERIRRRRGDDDLIERRRQALVTAIRELREAVDESGLVVDGRIADPEIGRLVRDVDTKYHTEIRDSQGIVVGGSGKVEMTFHYGPTGPSGPSTE